MHIFGLILLVALVGGGTGAYARGRVAGIAAHGTPRAARGARRVQHQAASGRTALGGKAAEIWAEAHSADWLERRRRARSITDARRARRQARPPVAERVKRAAIVTAGVAGSARERARRRWGQQPAAAEVISSGPATQDVPDTTTPAPQRPAPAPGRTTPVTTPSASPGPGAGADLFTAMQQLISAALSGGLRSKQRGGAALSDGLDYMATSLQAFARRLAEPDQHYPPAVWEAFSRAAAHLKAASSASGEGASAVGAIAAMTVGDLADSATQSPHHDELNAA